MKEAYKRFIILVACGLAACVPLFIACSDENGNGPTEPTFSYPHPNGGTWIYSYQGTDIIKYTISGSYNHPAAGDTQQLFTYGWNNGQWEQIDVAYLKVTANEVRLYLDPQASDFFLFLKIPLAVGNQWDAGAGYNAKVTSSENVSVPAGSWSCYKIDYTATNDSFTFWWPSNVGGMGAKNHGWWWISGTPITTELSSYNLPTS